METIELPKINFQQERKFDALISATFAFFKQEFKTLYKPLLYIFAPIFLIVSLILTSDQFFFISNNQNKIYGYMDTIFISSIIFLLVYIFVFYSLQVFTLSYVNVYISNEGNVDLKKVKNHFFKNYLPSIGWLSFMFLLFVVLFLFTMHFQATGLLISLFTIPWFLISTIFVLPIIIFEIFEQNNKFPFIRNLRLIKGNWWQTLGLVVLLSFLICIIFLTLGGVSIAIVDPNFSNPANFHKHSGMPVYPYYFYVYQGILLAINGLTGVLFAILISLQYFNLKKKQGNDEDEQIEVLDDNPATAR